MFNTRCKNELLTFLFSEGLAIRDQGKGIQIIIIESITP